MKVLEDVIHVCRSLLSMTSARVWLAIAGIAIGVPTSALGVQWAEFKTAKQGVDCQSDLIRIVGAPKGISGEEKIESIISASDNYSTCLSNIDPKKGTIEFVKEQHERQKAGVL